MNGIVKSVNKSSTYSFKKNREENIEIIENFGVKGDAHAGKTVKHRSRVAKDPSQPNLRQVHLIHSELFDELAKKDFTVNPGEMGENITTSGLDLLNLPKNTILQMGKAKIKITGLRSPCSQLDTIQDGLMKELITKDENGNVLRKAGIMAVALESGNVSVGDCIKVELPEKPHTKLEPV